MLYWKGCTRDCMYWDVSCTNANPHSSLKLAIVVTTSPALASTDEAEKVDRIPSTLTPTLLPGRLLPKAVRPSCPAASKEPEKAAPSPLNTAVCFKASPPSLNGKYAAVSTPGLVASTGQYIRTASSSADMAHWVNRTSSISPAKFAPTVSGLVSALANPNLVSANAASLLSSPPTYSLRLRSS